MTKKKRITIALSDKHIELLDILKVRFHYKQYSKVIIRLLDNIILYNEK